MKVRLLLFALVVAVVGLGACGGGGDDKSSEKAITKFVVNSIEYEITESTHTIFHKYPKTAENTWTGLPAWPIAPQITLSEKATISPPQSDKQNFETGVTYTVTAEDGSTQTYTVKAERGTW